MTDAADLASVPSVSLATSGADPQGFARAIGRSFERFGFAVAADHGIDAGLIARDVDPSDRRAFSLNITDTGRAMLTDCLARIDAHERRMLAGFSEAEKAMLLELLGRIERSETGAA